LLTFEWGESENRRRSKLYTLTPRGRARLTRASERWSRQLAAVGAVMAALPEET
jgi:DNA-binding PadR family transcriptional regulator